MCVYICTWYIYVYTYPYVTWYICTYTFINMYVHTCIYVYIHTHSYMYIHMYACVPTSAEVDEWAASVCSTPASICHFTLNDRHLVCCSALQYVAVCCSVLQYVAVCCSALQYVAVCCSMFQGFSGVHDHAVLQPSLCASWYKRFCSRFCSLLPHTTTSDHAVLQPSLCASWYNRFCSLIQALL